MFSPNYIQNCFTAEDGFINEKQSSFRLKELDNSWQQFKFLTFNISEFAWLLMKGKLEPPLLDAMPFVELHEFVYSHIRA